MIDPSDEERHRPRPWLAVALAAVPRGGCRWPLGEINDQEGFGFCGAPAVLIEKCGSYCERHHAVAYLRRGETQEDRDRAEGILETPES